MTKAAAVGSGSVGPAAAAGIGAVRVYQWTLRPFIGPNCRFWPSCSEYAVEAFRLHGALKGGAMATKRILRCNPWHEGGVDPVPQPHSPLPDSQVGQDQMGHGQMGHDPMGI